MGHPIQIRYNTNTILEEYRRKQIQSKVTVWPKARIVHEAVLRFCGKQPSYKAFRIKAEELITEIETFYKHDVKDREIKSTIIAWLLTNRSDCAAGLVLPLMQNEKPKKQ